MNRIAFGIVLIALVMLAAPVAGATPTVYFDPEPSNAQPGETITVTLWLNTSEGVAAFNDDIHFDTGVVNITDATAGDFYQMWTVVHYGDFIRIGGWSSDYLDKTGLLKLADLTFEGKNPGISTLYHTGNAVGHYDGTPVAATWDDGTFTCGGVQTFTKSLPAGWNLISLPLTPLDNSVGAVLSGVEQNAVKQYDATSKVFVDVTTTMDPGTAYFVHVTTASTWEYVGDSAPSTTSELKSGLNMIGVPNCAKGVGDAMGLTDYRYAARWNATSQSYEVYNPNAPAAFHGFTTMEAGEGYFVSAMSDSTLAVTCS